MKLDVEKVKLAQARAGVDLDNRQRQFLVRAKYGQTIKPQSLSELSKVLNCDPEYLIVKEG